jgi:hypothetical protein
LGAGSLLVSPSEGDGTVTADQGQAPAKLVDP